MQRHENERLKIFSIDNGEDSKFGFQCRGEMIMSFQSGICLLFFYSWFQQNVFEVCCFLQLFQQWAVLSTFFQHKKTGWKFCWSRRSDTKKILEHLSSGFRRHQTLAGGKWYSAMWPQVIFHFFQPLTDVWGF